MKLGHQVVGGYSGRFYTRTKTVNKRIEEHIEKTKKEIASKRNKRSMISACLGDMQKMFPEATVEKSETYQRWSKGYFTTVKITFENGFKVHVYYNQHLFDTEGKKELILNKHEFSVPSKANTMKFIVAMASIKLIFEESEGE